MLTQQHY